MEARNYRDARPTVIGLHISFDVALKKIGGGGGGGEALSHPLSLSLSLADSRLLLKYPFHDSAAKEDLPSYSHCPTGDKERTIAAAQTRMSQPATVVVVMRRDYIVVIQSCPKRRKLSFTRRFVCVNRTFDLP